MKSNAGQEFPVACIAMSAGAIPPLKKVIQGLSPNTGMAFMVIHHLRKYPTHLPAILSPCTSMPVALVADGQSVSPNHIYILPSGMAARIEDGCFSIEPSTKIWGWTNVATVFLQSLVRSRHPGIAVILSGGDKDASAALVDFKAKGGVVIVQDPTTATNPQMPLTSISTRQVDFVLPPDKIAHQLEVSAKHFRLIQQPTVKTHATAEPAAVRMAWESNIRQNEEEEETYGSAGVHERSTDLVQS